MEEGSQFHTTYTITNNIYNSFINTFKDKNPLHTNNDFAKEKNFEGIVMHGAILAGFLSHFIGEGLPLKNVLVQTYQLSFIKPVYLEDVLDFKAIITGVFNSVNTIEFKFTFSEPKREIVAKGKILISLI